MVKPEPGPHRRTGLAHPGRAAVVRGERGDAANVVVQVMAQLAGDAGQDAAQRAGAGGADRGADVGAEVDGPDLFQAAVPGFPGLLRGLVMTRHDRSATARGAG